MIEIEKIKSEIKINYGELEPGDVFNFGHKEAAIGLKTYTGHVLVESCLGTYSFQHNSPLKNNTPIILHGRLVKLGVKTKCNH